MKLLLNFNTSKKEINNEEPKEVKPKAKRTSKKNNIIVEDIKPVIEEPIQPVEEPPVEDVIKPKAKPKRTSKKNIVVEPIEEVESVEEPPVEEVKPKPKRASNKNNIIVEDIKPVEEVEPVEPKNIKTLEMVQCEQCNKKMTQNTLRYHHDKNCPGQPVDKKALPVKRRIKKKNHN